ncbi:MULTISPECIES: precorrin-2 C(20)-methyltransferase [unclassified Dysgonomonas]|jgi:precorrin-2/cobalt-factor-2 C20-methyltransferase|uniref:precorrin-2 C(20)-methyltransferase n=1 Tax=unclassified Dysgonomonas TaxID=2630389 RepID=UPI0025C150E1|nr:MULTISPECIES: precorrin-2 C(20)-methyltransferase [unclassified Dysgonomonas]MDR2001836.1 precorrin-2 C(20)-methyltransferase [Prevotella sp.]HMM04216.1 precorrin-2 C(20)-methyltransferase [Dysgonomonas sp.]
MFDSVMFVSLGPGDPELITLKGLKALQKADLIFCPSTALPGGKSSSRAKDVLLQLGIGESKLNIFNVPMNKDRSLAIESYKAVAEEISDKYKTGHKIAVTAEGDAGFYSTIYYISEYLTQENIPVSRIAGVPAFIACGTLANIHIVKQEEELEVIPGIITLNSLKEKIKTGKTVVLMKASQCEQVIKEALENIQDITFHYFENAGISGKEVYTQNREEILNRKFPYFSLIIIRK